MSTPARINSKSRRIVLLVAGLVMLCVTLLLAEGSARLLLPYRNPIRIFVKPAVTEDMQRSMAPVVEFDPELSYRLRPGTSGGHLAATTFNSNRDGIRRDEEVGTKPAKGVRILCVGDSCTFGFGVPSYWKDQPNLSDPRQKSYVPQVEELLRASFPGKSIEVLNLGVPGYSTSQGVISVARNLPKYDGDIVTVMFFNNDIMDPGASGRATRPGGAQLAIRKLAARSQLVTHLIEWSNRRSDPPKLQGFGTPNTAIEDYLTNFEQMREICAKRGAQLVVINPFFQLLPENDPWLPAHRVTEFRECLKSYVRSAGLPFLDIPELTEAHHPANNSLFIERVHPNYEGHSMIAQKMHDLLRPMVEKKLAALEAPGR